MEQAPSIPDDIIAEVIGILARSNDNQGANRFQHIIKFSTLSSFCLHQVRTHVFAHVILGSGVEDSQILIPSGDMSLQLYFFSEHPWLLPYIRHLDVMLCEEDMEDEASQIKLHEMMIQLDNVTELRISNLSADDYRYRKDFWCNLPEMSIRSAMQSLLWRSDLRGISRLGIERWHNFPLHDLVYATNLRELRISDTTVVPVEEEDFKISSFPRTPHRLERLEAMTITDYTGVYEEPGFEDIKRALTVMDKDSGYRFQLSKIKSLKLELRQTSDSIKMVELIQAHRMVLLETLELLIELNGWCLGHGAEPEYPFDCARWLDILLLPLQKQLKMLKVQVQIQNRARSDNPLAGFCSTLARMSDHNTLESISLLVTVNRKYIRRTVTNISTALNTALDQEDRWKSLKKVELYIVVLASGPSKPSTQSMDRLRHSFQPLYSKQFCFEYQEQCLLTSVPTSMQQAPSIPDDIIAEIIGILASSNDNQGGNPFRHILNFSTLSSFCRHQVRTHIFADVSLGLKTQEVFHTLSFATIPLQLDFFSKHPWLLPYIRRLNVSLSEEDMEDEGLQVGLHKMMIQLDNLTELRIFNHRSSYDDQHRKDYWCNLPKTSIRSGMQYLLWRPESRGISRLVIQQWHNFPLHDLVYASNLRHLCIYSTTVVTAEEDSDNSLISRTPHHLERLESLTTSGYLGFDEEPGFDEIQRGFSAIDKEGEYLFRLSKLKSLIVEVRETKDFIALVELIQVQHMVSLEELELSLYLNGWYDEDQAEPECPFDCSEWLDSLLLPLHMQLKKLKVEIEVESRARNENPFAGLFSTLARMPDCSTLESISLSMAVSCKYLHQSVTSVSSSLNNTLDKEDKWKHLKKVALYILAFSSGFRRPSSEYMESLRDSFQPLSSKKFSFEYNFNISRVNRR
ncbi:hypothetical protein CVT24_011301 [Panaeolus cyanescens]|uniref:Uncharacterized protein n=1 Tax=Panaeolus cyanescens TaxID=181874 RepID=A0A409WQJ9_9AGAR|nr:hypothetical protein CVT24_011301 [Panaeolus cyanescens]